MRAFVSVTPYVVAHGPDSLEQPTTMRGHKRERRMEKTHLGISPSAV